MCFVCLFALFDIISATLNSPLRCYCCLNPRTIDKTKELEKKKKEK